MPMPTSPTRTPSPSAPAETAQPGVQSADGGKAFGWTFWMLNTIEAFERLAYFGIRSVVPIYIMQATEPGGLHLTAVHKGVIYGWWAIFQSWLPMVTGGFADRFGYKRTLAFAISMNVVGYVLMAYLHSYVGFFTGIIVLATGTAFFKPALQGSLAQKLHKDNASMGWGIFYWVVNVGAVCAPLLATLILGRPHSAEGWKNLFLASAAYTAMNLLLLFTFRDVPSGADKTKNIIEVFWTTVENICPFWFRGGDVHPLRFGLGLAMLVTGISLFIVQPIAALAGHQSTLAALLCVLGVLLPLWLKGGVFTWQLRLPAFIVIMSCFWMMMYQLWDLHPNFIEDWVDSSSAARMVPFDSWWEYGDRGLKRVPQQILLNLNAALIVALIIPISWLVRRMRTLSAMLIGMIVATIGILVAGLTGSGWILLLGIVFFSLGEMLTGPKKNQYLGLIAPPGKKGLYLGYVNIPVGLGVGVGSIVAGLVYDTYGEKATLALKELGKDSQLVARAARSIDWSDSLELLPEITGIHRDSALTEVSKVMQCDPDAAAERLLLAFRWDHGQITNLALLYLAHQDDAELTTKKFISNLNESIAKTNAKKRPEVAVLQDTISMDGFDRKALALAPIVDLLPTVIGRGRSEAFDIVRERINKDRKYEDRLSDSQIIAQLWDHYGVDTGVLNNLALEYLAQNTDLVSARITPMSFSDPVEDLPKRAGIGRTKSFVALSCARGASNEEVQAALSGIQLDESIPEMRSVVYLANLEHRRFNAVAKRDWSRFQPLLAAMIESDPKARQIARDGIRAGGELNYAELAKQQKVIQDALSAKDWAAAPRQAAELLELNPYEAHALVAAEVRGSFLSTTSLLWSQYAPQYRVWIPFAAIGIIATIALAIFGQMAKRWADMNA